MSPSNRNEFLVQISAATLIIMTLFSLPLSASPLRPTTQEKVPKIVYSLTLDQSKTQRLLLEIAIPNPGTKSVTFSIPAWTPGFYQLLHFERSIEQVKAEDDSNHSLTVKHASLRSWQVSGYEAPTAKIFLRYEVKAVDKGFGFFGSMFDSKSQTAYVNGASAFMYLEGEKQYPVEMKLKLPAGWKAATPLDEQPQNNLNKEPEVHSYLAKDYDELIDCPLQLGKFDSFDFKVGEVPYQCVLVGDHQANIPKVRDKLSRIATASKNVFKMSPFRRYVFFYHIGGSGFEGGLEHRSSTVIHLSEPIKDADEDDFLTTSSHELFHAWNVKYLRPEGLGPFDYAQPVRTSSLWWAEGVTDYYADVLLFRAELRSADWALKQLGQHISQLDNNPARNRVTLEEASRKSWEGQSEGFGGLSYYLKGGLVGFYFDLKIREATQGSKTLDDVMQEMIETYGKKDKGYPESALLATLSHVANSDLTEVYKRYVKGVTDLDWAPVLKDAGLALSRTQESFLGVSFGPLTESEARDDLQANDIFARVERVEQGSPAEKLGLKEGDVIERINDKTVSFSIAGPTIRTLQPSSEIALYVKREGRNLQLKGTTGVRFGHHSLTTSEAPGAEETYRPIQLGLFQR